MTSNKGNSPRLIGGSYWISAIQPDTMILQLLEVSTCVSQVWWKGVMAALCKQLSFDLLRNMLRRPTEKPWSKSWHSILAVFFVFLSRVPLSSSLPHSNILCPEQQWNPHVKTNETGVYMGTQLLGMSKAWYFQGFNLLLEMDCSHLILQGTWPKWPMTAMAAGSWRRGCPMVRSAKYVDSVWEWTSLNLWMTRQLGGLTRVTGFWQFWRVLICFDHVDHIVQICGYGSMLRMIYHGEVDEHLEWAVRPLMF